MPPKAKKPSSIAKKPTSKPKQPSSKTAGKRAHNSESEDDDAPPSKKTRKEDDAKMVTVLKRGSAPVDPMSNCVHTHQVYAADGEVWDAMLNQTDISGSTNSNKFYVLQLLQKVGGSNECTLYTRWGRVGEPGANQTKGPWPPSEAIIQFKKQFKSKTATSWEQRKGMTVKKGKYTWLGAIVRTCTTTVITDIACTFRVERDFEDEAEEAHNTATGSGSGNVKEREKTPESTLAFEVQALCKLIFSTSLLSAHLSSMNYDANKLPLGKLSKANILRGFAILKELAEVLEDPTAEATITQGGVQALCAALSGQYYSVIPHAFGRGRPTVINSMELLKAELNLVDALGDMEIAQEIISSSTVTDEEGRPLNQLDAHFNSLRLSSMTTVARGSKEFEALESYAKDTHGQTHRYYKAEVLNIFRVERAAESEAFMQAGYGKLADGERMLLWHGSRTTNFAGIFKQGLRIAPPEAPTTGYMFGKGVYFADMMSKSANYCFASLSDNIGLLLLCEVAVKPFFEKMDADYNADQGCKAASALSTKGIGMTQPVEWQDAGTVLEHPELVGVHMPKGGSQDVKPPGAYLQYNEYIVYSASQIRLRYVMMVKMT